MTITIQQAIDTIIAAVPGGPPPDTVDTVKIGDPTQPLTGIVTTFLATVEVTEQAAQFGANLIITHEPIFYNHRDETDWFAGKSTYEAKRRLIEQQRVVIWRFHDLLHTLQPDPTVAGLLDQLEWIASALPEQLHLCHIPSMTLRQFADWVKTGCVSKRSRCGRSRHDVSGHCAAARLSGPGRADRRARAGGGRCRHHRRDQRVGDQRVPARCDAARPGERVACARPHGQRGAGHALGHALASARLPGVDIRFVPTGRMFHWL